MNPFIKWSRKPLQYKTYRYSVTMVIIFINVVVFLAININRNLLPYVVLNPTLFLHYKHYWTIATYMFAHASISHLFFNMLGLYFFGTVVERIWGANEYILIYALVGVLSGAFSLVYYVLNNSMGVFLLGASGALYGVMLIFACMFPHQRIYVFGIFPLSAKVLMLIFIGIQIFSALTAGQSNIAYFTHLSGIVVAWLYLYIRQNINPYRRLVG